MTDLNVQTIKATKHTVSDAAITEAVTMAKAGTDLVFVESRRGWLCDVVRSRTWVEGRICILLRTRTAITVLEVL